MHSEAYGWSGFTDFPKIYSLTQFSVTKAEKERVENQFLDVILETVLIGPSYDIFHDYIGT